MSSSLANRAFLRACAVADPDDWDDDGLVLRTLRGDEWNVVAQHAREHGLAGWLARNLAWAREKTGFQAPILDELDALRHGQLVQHLVRKAAVRRIAEALERNGLPFVIFKGVVLAEEVYGDLSLRGFHDCDVMVQLGRLDDAYDVAVELGYVLYKFDHARECVKLGFHAAQMAHRDGTGLDLHWSIANDMLAPDKVEMIWEHCGPSGDVSRLPGLRLSPEMALIQLAKHFHSHRYRTIKPLLDFYLTARKFRAKIDVKKLADLAQALNVLPLVDIATTLCMRCFFPESMLPLLGTRKLAMQPRLARRIITDDLILSGFQRMRPRYWLHYVLAAGGFRSSTRILVDTLLPRKLFLVDMFDPPYRPSMYWKYYRRQFLSLIGSIPSPSPRKDPAPSNRF